MLELFKFKSKNNGVTKLNNNGQEKGIIRHYPSATKEWFNSIYTYNKNALKLLPVADNVVVNLLRSYFNMYSSLLEKRIKAPRMRTWKRRLSSRKIWVSKAELKHTSGKVTITLYIFNRQNTYYVKKLNNMFSIKRIFKFFTKTLKPTTQSYLENVRSQYSTLFSTILEGKLVKAYEVTSIKNFIIEGLKKEILLMYYLQSIALNKLKFTSAYISPLKALLSKFYGKKVVLNLVTLKNYYLNSDILTQILIDKTRNRKNRVIKVLKASIVNIDTPRLNPKLIIRESTKYVGKQNLLITDSINLNNSGDVLNRVINNNFIKHEINKEKNNKLNIFKTNKEENILNSLKNKAVSGVRLEASGRLTKRITAARAVFKVKYVGTLKNVDASYKGLSSVILRGNIKSNIQHTKLNSKTRIGSFGLKGWVSSI